jgi:hypothetical protein
MKRTLITIGAVLAVEALFALFMLIPMRGLSPASANELAGSASDIRFSHVPPPAVAMAPPAAPKPMPKRMNAFGSAGKMKGRSGDVDADGIPDAKDAEGGEEAVTLGLVGRTPGGAVDQSEARPVPTRAWFPETFLFQPLVVTDASGHVSVETRVPDRLTSWRVLALAFSREGAQAGTTTTFLGTLPAYVDPVVPGFLMVGDRVRLPIQVVNTTEEASTPSFHVDAEGAEVSGAPAKVTLPAQGNEVVFASLTASHPGVAALRAVLGGADAVVRTIPVRPTGRPVQERRGGTLAAPRSIEVAGPDDMDRDSAKVRLMVFPGALAILRSELTAVLGRGGVADDAYALLLAGRAAALIRSLGEEPDTAAIRTLTITAAQRVIRDGRSPDATSSMLLAEAALEHPDNPVLARLGERMAQTAAQAQRPDGTFAGADGWTLQRLLVTTAEGVEAVRVASNSSKGRQRAQGASVRAAGAFERNLEQVRDGYTAASIVASGAVSGSTMDRLREQVRDAVKANPDGSRYLPIEEGVVRSDGSSPTIVEATALAALALAGDAKAPWRADLGATLLGSYDPSMGWGDGRTNLWALRAVTDLFKEHVPPSVNIRLAMDGKTVRETTLDTSHTRDVTSIEVPAPEAKGAHTWTVAAEPAVPGLGFSFALMTWVPWKKETAPSGVELALESATAVDADKAVNVTVVANAPEGMPLRIHHSLPAGFQPDTSSLDNLVSEGRITSYRTEEGGVNLDVAGLEAGQTFTVRYRVIPTLVGSLHSAASTVSLVSQPETIYHLPPVAWTVQ